MKTNRLSYVVLLTICGAMMLANRAMAVPMVSDANLLSGLAATASNVNVSGFFDDGSGTVDYGPQNATNGTGGGAGKDFVFPQGNAEQLVALTGFNSALGFVRVWSSSDLAPSHITIYSSTTSQTSLSSSNYSLIVPTTTPVWTAGTGASAGLEYITFPVTAAAGTQSLLFDFGTTNSGNPQIPGFVRIAELQALPTPEPASLVLSGLGAIGLLAVVRRRRA
jgi:hypothetical protein